MGVDQRLCSGEHLASRSGQSQLTPSCFLHNQSYVTLSQRKAYSSEAAASRSTFCHSPLTMRSRI